MIHSAWTVFVCVRLRYNYFGAVYWHSWLGDRDSPTAVSK